MMLKLNSLLSPWEILFESIKTQNFNIDCMNLIVYITGAFNFNQNQTHVIMFTC